VTDHLQELVDRWRWWISWLDQVFDDRDLSASARVIAYMISRHANVITNLATVSKGRLVRQSGISKRALDNAIADLEQRGHLSITRHRRPGKRKNDENTYQLIMIMSEEIPFE
jgi:hypothetical protein